MWKIHSKHDDNTEVIKELTVESEVTSHLENLIDTPNLKWVKIYKDGKRISSISFDTHN